MSDSKNPWTAAHQASLSFIISQSLFKVMSTEFVMPSNHLSSVASFSSCPNLSQHQGLFQWVGLVHQVAKVLELQIQHQSFNEYLSLIYFRMDRLDLLAVQRTLKSLLQHHSSKALILRCSAFFIAQISHPCMTTGKTIALTIWTFVDKVMSLLLKMLSSFVSALFFLVEAGSQQDIFISFK